MSERHSPKFHAVRMHLYCDLDRHLPACLSPCVRVRTCVRACLRECACAEAFSIKSLNCCCCCCVFSVHAPRDEHGYIAKLTQHQRRRLTVYSTPLSCIYIYIYIYIHNDYTKTSDSIPFAFYSKHTNKIQTNPQLRIRSVSQGDSVQAHNST